LKSDEKGGVIWTIVKMITRIDRITRTVRTIRRTIKIIRAADRVLALIDEYKR